jgi:ribosome-binding protein aMBF1 (putative translation factor)
MGASEVRFVREVFHLSQRSLAKSMNVAPFTVSRWEKGESTPTGLQEEVLRALHNIALQLQSDNDSARAAAIGSLIGLGIGALIVLLLSGKSVA